MISIEKFGTHLDRPIYRAKLTGSSGVQICIISYGASIQRWHVPMANEIRPVVLGFEQFELYPKHSPFFGAIVGRVANRIDHASFEINGKGFDLNANDGPHQLHGGALGLSQQVWEMEADNANNSVALSYISQEREMGYPGRVEFKVIYTLLDNCLRIELYGDPDCETPISLAQHNYFNLGNTGDVLDHRFFIAADRYNPVNGALIPTGDVLPVLDSIYDFRHGKSLRDAHKNGIDYDINLWLKAPRDLYVPIAQVHSPQDDLRLKLYSDRPGIQLYNGANMAIDTSGSRGPKFGAFSGFCLEDQMVPDALHHANFPSIICSPNQPYRHWCEIEILPNN